MPSQGFRHAVNLLLKNGIRASKDAEQLAEELVALAADMKAPPEAAEWVKAEYARLFGPGASSDTLNCIGQNRAQLEPRDLFLIYAPEDRLPAAGPLAIELTKRGVRVAFSEYEVANRHELRTAIERGLVDHRAGVLLFSTEFARKPWSDEPLDPRLIIVRDPMRPAAAADAIVKILERTGADAHLH